MEYITRYSNRLIQIKIQLLALPGFKLLSYFYLQGLIMEQDILKDLYFQHCN